MSKARQRQRWDSYSVFALDMKDIMSAEVFITKKDIIDLGQQQYNDFIH
jgi:hypothetical protein